MSLLLRLEQQQKTFVKIHSNSHISLSFFLISWSEMINTFENHTRFQTKIGKHGILVFRPNRRKNPALWGGTYLYGLYKGAPQVFNFSFFLRVKVTSIP